MSFERRARELDRKLYALLPAIHRARDQERDQSLRALLGVLAEQLAVIEENLQQLSDDQFIETCAEWVVPYIGDLIGYRSLHGEAVGLSSRAEVAHTIALRRRKGTASVLEQLARDVTGWNARAVEFFQTLATTQHMNHVRPQNHSAPDLRRWEPLQRVGSAFDTVAHTIDVRRISSKRGRHNIPNVGIFLWPVDAYSATRSAAVQVDDRRWRISPLNHDFPLYNLPRAEDEITHIAERNNVPMSLSRRELEADFDSYYGRNLSLAIYFDDDPKVRPASEICICDLSGDGAIWAHLPQNKIAVDPLLGRIALPPPPVPPAAAVKKISVTYHYGFSADLGGGEYEREDSFVDSGGLTVLHVPTTHPTIQSALTALGGEGVVVIEDNGRYEESLTVAVKKGSTIELRGANEKRPSLVLKSEFKITGEAKSGLIINGLLISGDKLRVADEPGNELASLRIIHSTLVPGWTLASSEGHPQPQSPDQPSLVVEIDDTEVVIERSITGGLRTHSGAKVSARDSFIDATDLFRVAFSALDNIGAGGSLSLDGCTMIGKVHARSMPLVSNSLLLARLAASGDTWELAVRAERRQDGCVRFSWLPEGSRVPRRHQCVDPENSSGSPSLLSLSYGTPTYGRLSKSTHPDILQGADDGGELGAFHHLLASQREANLRIRLEEYLRAGLEAGIFYEI